MAGISGASGRTSYGISGMVSGLDTDTLVESLTAMTSNKIDEQNRQKQTLSWKQDSYREIGKGISEFVEKYLNTNSKNCILNSSFFTNYSATASVEGFVNISGSVENAANVQIKNVSSLAKAATYTCTNNNLVNKLQINKEKLASFEWNENGTTEVSFYLDGRTETITINKADFIDEDGNAKSNVEIASKLNELLADKFLDNNGNPMVSVSTDLTFATTNSSSTFAVSAGGDVFGIDKQYGTQVTVNNTLGSLGLTASGETEDGLKTYDLTVNGNSWTFTEEDTISTVLKKINGGKTGVTASFSAISKTFTFKTTATGADQKIEMSGGLAEELFGYVKDEYTYSNPALTAKDSLNRDSLYGGLLTTDGKKTFSVTVDGVTKEISLSTKFGHELYNSAGGKRSNNYIAETINKKLAEAFGNGVVTASFQGDELVFNAADGKTASVKDNQVKGTHTLKDLQGVLGLTGENGQYSLNINGKALTFAETTTLDEMMKTINDGDYGVRLTYDNAKNSFSFEAKEAGQTIKLGGELGTKLFGYTSRNTGGFITRREDGKNMEATLIVDGVETKVERNGNSMTFNGLTMEFVKEYSEQEAISFAVENDNEAVVDKMQEFIDEYNGIVNTIHAMITQKPDRDYYALTDAEKEEMSETEIKNWEAKAKEGLLYNDSTLTGLLNSLRSTMYTAVDGSLLAQFGITTVSTTNTSKKNNGQLELNKATFVDALNNKSTDLINLFTKNDSGILYSSTLGGTKESNDLRKERTAGSGLMQRLSDILNDMVYTGTPKGKLLQIAGLAGDRTDGDNQLTKKMSSIDNEIDRLQDRLERERTRYYNKFNAMEEALSKLNSTSSYIASMLGTNTGQ